MPKSAVAEKEKNEQIEKVMSISIGGATVCYNAAKRAWVKPGGALIQSERAAKAFCQKLSQLM
jgi:hypothetical protein